MGANERHLRRSSTRLDLDHEKSRRGSSGFEDPNFTQVVLIRERPDVVPLGGWGYVFADRQADLTVAVEHVEY